MSKKFSRFGPHSKDRRREGSFNISTQSITVYEKTISFTITQDGDRYSLSVSGLPFESVTVNNEKLK